MTNLVELTLAAAIGMAGAFQSGLESLHEEQYEMAAGYFTKVLEAEVPAQEFYWPALYYRAQAHASRGERDAVLRDAGKLLVSDAAVSLKGKALALFQSQEGDLKALRPETGPKQFLEQAVAAFRLNNEGAVRDSTSGPLSELIQVMEILSHGRGMGARGGFLPGMIGESAGPVFSDEQFDDTNRTATVLMTIHHGVMGMRIGLTNRNGEWSATELKEFVVRDLHNRGFQPIAPGESAASQVTMQKEDVDEALALEAQGLIKELGDRQASVRAAARRRLAEIKDAVRPFLEEHVNDPDPEIQMTIRELLR